MKTETLQESLGVYRQKLQAGARNVGAAYELAQASSRSYQPGDQVSYYVTGESKRVSVNEAAKLAAEWSPDAPDENTAYYVAKLQELYEKFRPLIEQDGLSPVVEAEPRARRRPAGQPVRLRGVRPHQTSESWRGRAGASARTRSSRVRAGKPTSAASRATRRSISSR